MQKLIYAFSFVMALGIVLGSEYSQARAQRPVSVGGSSGTSSSDAGSSPTSVYSSGQKLRFTAPDGTTRIFTIAELEAMGPIRRGDGSIWMNGPGTFPGVKPGESINLQNILNSANNSASPSATGANPVAATPVVANTVTTTQPPSGTASANASSNDNVAGTPQVQSQAANDNQAVTKTPPPPADVQPASDNFCFKNLQEYNQVKDKLPPMIQRVPFYMTGNGQGASSTGAAVRVTESQGRLVLRYGINVNAGLLGTHNIADESYLKEMCFDAKTKKYKMVLDNNKEFELEFTGPQSVVLRHMFQEIGFRSGNDSEFNNIFGAVNSAGGNKFQSGTR